MLVRLRDADSSEHENCMRVFEVQRENGAGLILCSQVMIEYWVVATRPVTANGLGLSPAEAEADLCDLEQLLPFIDDPADILLRWRRLVDQHAIRGLAAHDAQLMALMEGHGPQELLTLNLSDFARFRQINCITPAELLARHG